MKRLGYFVAGLLLVAGVLSTALAAERLVLFEYFTNTG